LELILFSKAQKIVLLVATYCFRDIYAKKHYLNALFTGMQRYNFFPTYAKFFFAQTRMNESGELAL